MAAGDVVLTLAIEGGSTKTVTLDSATRGLSRTFVTAVDPAVDTDTEWAVTQINSLANYILSEANQQARTENATARTFTAAT